MRAITISVFLCLLNHQITLAKSYEVKMLDNLNGEAMVFEPSYLKINVGDEVTFKAIDNGHNSQSIYTPDKSKGWVGEVSQPITVSFKQEGVYIYECLAHSVMGMIGVVQVGDMQKNSKAIKTLESFKQNLAMNKQRLDHLIKKIESSKKEPNP